MKTKIIFVTIAVIFFFIVIGIKLFFFKNETTEVKKDILTAVGQSGEKTIILYFPDNNLDSLIKKKYAITSDGYILNDIKKVFELLKKGEKEFGISSLLPDETILLTNFINNGILYLNFSSHILENRGSSEEYLLIKEIVYTFLDSFPSSIKKVQFLVENKTVKTFGKIEDSGHIDISKPYMKNSF